MKLFVAIAITLAGAILLIAAIGDINNSPTEAVFGIVSLAAGIIWLWQIHWQLKMATKAAESVLSEMHQEHDKPIATENTVAKGFCCYCGVPLSAVNGNSAIVHCKQCGQVFDALAMDSIKRAIIR